jgi:hypothetical protein
VPASLPKHLRHVLETTQPAPVRRAIAAFLCVVGVVLMIGSVQMGFGARRAGSGLSVEPSTLHLSDLPIGAEHDFELFWRNETTRPIQIVGYDDC